MDFELSQILEGPANEACSLFDCIKCMPPGGGSDVWRHLPRPPEGQHQLDVFLHRSRDGAVEQKVVDFIRWLEDRSDVSTYMWMVNLVQVWMPISSGDGDETILSVSGQPFGVGRLSNGIFRYRYDSILSNDRNTCPSGGGDLISMAFTTGFPNSEHCHHHLYGIQSRWTLPLVDPTTGMPIGVLEFVTMNQYRSEYHGMLTQCFLDFGPKYYERFYKQYHHLPTQEDTTFGKDRSFWQAMYDVSNELLGNANEEDTNYANGLGMQQNTMNFEIGESSVLLGKDNFSNGIEYQLSSDVSANGLWPTSNDPVPAQDNTGIGEISDFSFFDIDPAIFNGTEAEEVPVPIILEITDANNEQMDEIFQSLDDNPAIRDGAEGEQVGGVTNDIIEDTTQRRSSPAISRKPRQPISCDQLRRNFGRPLQEVANEIGVHLSTAKRRCRECDIQEWPSSKKRIKATKKNMIVKATYGNITVKVRSFDSTKEFEWLTKELGLKLKLQVGSFRIQYKDDTGNPITIFCTEHLMKRLDSLFSANMKTMYLIVSLDPTS